MGTASKAFSFRQEYKSNINMLTHPQPLHLYNYQLRSKGDNTFGSVHLSVRPSVRQLPLSWLNYSREDPWNTYPYFNPLAWKIFCAEGVVVSTGCALVVSQLVIFLSSYKVKPIFSLQGNRISELHPMKWTFLNMLMLQHCNSQEVFRSITAVDFFNMFKH